MEVPKHFFDRWAFSPDALPWAPAVKRLATWGMIYQAKDADGKPVTIFGLPIYYVPVCYAPGTHPERN